MYSATIRTEPARRLACSPHRGRYDQISKGFAALERAITAQGLWPKVGAMIGVYHDSPDLVAEGDLRAHAGLELAEGPIAPPLEEVRLPAGRHVVVTVRGPYSGLPAAYDHLFRTWLPASGESFSGGAIFEIYLNAPMTAAPDDLLTEI